MLQFPYKIFISIHRMLIFKMLGMDVVLGIIGCVFLSLPLNISALTLDNLVLLLILIITATLFQIQILKTNSGTPVFYLSLPIKKIYVLPIYIINSALPVLFTLILFVVSQYFLSDFKINQALLSGNSFTKLYYAWIIFTIVKILPIPLLVLFKKHPVLVPFLLILFAGEYFILAILVELFLKGFVLQNEIISFFLLILIFISCVKIISKIGYN